MQSTRYSYRKIFFKKIIVIYIYTVDVDASRSLQQRTTLIPRADNWHDVNQCLEPIFHQTSMCVGCIMLMDDQTNTRVT